MAVRAALTQVCGHLGGGGGQQAAGSEAAQDTALGRLTLTQGRKRCYADTSQGQRFPRVWHPQQQADSVVGRWGPSHTPTPLQMHPETPWRDGMKQRGLHSKTPCQGPHQ